MLSYSGQIYLNCFNQSSSIFSTFRLLEINTKTQAKRMIINNGEQSLLHFSNKQASPIILKKSTINPFYLLIKLISAIVAISYFSFQFTSFKFMKDRTCIYVMFTYKFYLSSFYINKKFGLSFKIYTVVKSIITVIRWNIAIF